MGKQIKTLSCSFEIQGDIYVDGDNLDRINFDRARKIFHEKLQQAVDDLGWDVEVCNSDLFDVWAHYNDESLERFADVQSKRDAKAKQLKEIRTKQREQRERQELEQQQKILSKTW